MLFSPERTQRVVFLMAQRMHRNSDGNLYVRYLYWNDDQWNWSYNWLDNDWNADNPAAMLVSDS